VAKVLGELEKKQQLTRLAPPTTDFLRSLAPHVTTTSTAAAATWLSSILRAVLQAADNKIINPILSQILGWPAVSPPDIQALVRTTCAMVTISAGSESSHNIVPSDATITVNCRLLPGDTVADVRRYLEDVVLKGLNKDTNVLLPTKPELVQVDEGVPGSAVASCHGPHFDLIRRSILESGLTGGTGIGTNSTTNKKRVEIVVPSLLTGMTDSRHYSELAQGRMYRFSPLGLNRGEGDMKRIHGIDERVSVENVIEAVRFFMRLISIGTTAAGAVAR
jgi:carboxypeptidase PM20D1